MRVERGDLSRYAQRAGLNLSRYAQRAGLGVLVHGLSLHAYTASPVPHAPLGLCIAAQMLFEPLRAAYGIEFEPLRMACGTWVLVHGLPLHAYTASSVPHAPLGLCIAAKMLLMPLRAACGLNLSRYAQRAGRGF